MQRVLDPASDVLTRRKQGRPGNDPPSGGRAQKRLGVVRPDVLAQLRLKGVADVVHQIYVFLQGDLPDGAAESETRRHRPARWCGGSSS